MKVQETRARKEDRTRIFLSAGSQGAYFAILTYAHGDHVLSGFVGAHKGGQIPSVKPVRLQLSEGLSDEICISAASHWMLAQGAGIEIANPFSVGGGLVDQASTWASFLNQSDAAPEPDESRISISLPAEMIATLRDRLRLIRIVDDVVASPRRANFRIGAPVDGFSACKAHRNIAKIFPHIIAATDLDLETARRATGSVARPSSQAVAWYATPDKEVSRLRIQAAESYPVLAGMIAESPSLSRRVDEMSPISEVLIKRSGLSKAALKRIGKLKAPPPDGPIFEPGEEIRGEDALGINRARRTAIRGSVSLTAGLSVLSRMPPDRTPQTDADWIAFNETLSACAMPISNAFMIPEDEILGASKGNWRGWKDQLARASDFDPERFDRRTLALATIDALEAIEDFSRTVILPLALRSIQSTDQDIPPQTPEYMRQAAEAAGEILLGRSKSVAGTLLEIGRRYASRIPALLAIDGQSNPDYVSLSERRWERYQSNEFPILMEAYRASNGLVVRPLKSHEEMAEQSSRLVNCMGRFYRGHASDARSHLFAIEDEAGTKSYSNIELSGILQEGSESEIRAGIKLVQHNGMRNGAPAPEAVEAYTQWMTAIRSGEISLNIEEIQAWREYRKQNKLEARKAHGAIYSWTGALGTEWANEEKVAQHWEEWSGIISSPAIRGNSPEVLFRHEPIRRLVEDMSPAAATILQGRARAAAEEAAAERQAEATASPGI